MKFSISCFFASVVCFIVGDGRLVLGERVSDLELLWVKFLHWLGGGEVPTVIMKSHCFLLRFGKSFWGFFTDADGSPFFCWVAAVLFVLGVLAFFGALLDSSSASGSSSENSNRT